jgi:hypothetical protein
MMITSFEGLVHRHDVAARMAPQVRITTSDRRDSEIAIVGEEEKSKIATLQLERSMSQRPWAPISRIEWKAQISALLSLSRLVAAIN